MPDWALSTINETNSSGMEAVSVLAQINTRVSYIAKDLYVPEDDWHLLYNYWCVSRKSKKK